MSVFTNRIEGDNVDVVHVDGTIAVSNPGLTDAQLRATPVPVSGTVTANLGTVDGLALDATLTNGTQHTLVDNFPATQPISGSVTVLNASIPVTGTFWQAIQPVSGTVAVSNFPATVAVTQSTSPWVVSGTITANLGTIDGAATAANQATELTDLSSIIANQTNGTQTVSVLNFPADADALAQGSSTSGQLGALEMGAVTTAAPTYTTGTTNPLSIDTSGNLRVTSASNKATVSTITRVATGTAAVTVLTANAARKKFVIRTETGTHNYVAYGSAATATNYTYDLGPDATLEETVWTGLVSVTRLSGTGAVQVTDLV